MARQANDGRRVPPGRNPTTGAAVLDREETALDRLGVDKTDLFDLVPQSVVVMDRDHTILHLNEAAAQAAGKAREACVGAKFWSLFDNPGCRAGTCAAAQAVNTGKVCTGEARPIVQGRQITVVVTAAPVFDNQRQVVGVVELIVPVDAEKEATIAAIGKSQAVIEFQMDGTVITANDNFLKALGYTLDEVKGRHHSMARPGNFGRPPRGHHQGDLPSDPSVPDIPTQLGRQYPCTAAADSRVRNQVSERMVLCSASFVQSAINPPRSR